MALTTAKNFLLLTERIDDKPMLRTRFTAQAYFLLATLLDLLDQGVLQVDGDRIVVPDVDRFDQLPQYLNALRIRLTSDLMQNDQLKTALKLVTSWDIVNAVYDGIGAETLTDGTTERVLFQNNLKPHVIYEPKDASRQAVIADLKAQIASGQPNHPTINLYAVLAQTGALKWVFGEVGLDKLQSQFETATSVDPYAQTVQLMTTTAGEIIQSKKFEMDSWLS
ncbi:hypothetical protein [Levilactobacillus cerevisiae]|uniref:hypothetical protein n=1 Tax=Levilactobacillus cerevisiae TaxID=1704076 RepID=UPI000F7B07A5|nr:hypothetical protein [Levilactobacillus cerevisiae]